ncbi:MAG: prolipoprotein diacylglyceryl transferase [Bacteroidales bacterium]|nr:prolipoprotein diacylglyceryl transferase [Bacteroidales bacterium]
MMLFVNWDVDPILLSIGNFQIRYYGLLFITGFYLGYYMFRYFFRREEKPLDLLDALLWTLMICTVVGARLGHCLFYQPDYYLANPGEILKVWEGGLASHGGTIAIMIGMWWFIKKYGRKHNFGYIWLLDRLAIATAFAAMFIRLGNLMNSEIYGHQTSLPWGFIFLQNGETVAKHPTQLYEALCYLGTGIVLFCIYKYALPKIKEGLLLGIFFIGIFFSRFLIEFVKENQVSFEEGMTLNMGQLLSIPFVLLGIFLIVRSFMSGTPAAMRLSGQKGKR